MHITWNDVQDPSASGRYRHSPRLLDEERQWRTLVDIAQLPVGAPLILRIEECCSFSDHSQTITNEATAVAERRWIDTLLDRLANKLTELLLPVQMIRLVYSVRHNVRLRHPHLVVHKDPVHAIRVEYELVHSVADREEELSI